MATTVYGPYGILDRPRWRQLLDSGAGLFKPVPGRPDGVIGPTLVKNGRIVGDMLAVETSLFAAGAMPEQYELYRTLSEECPAKATEYMLTMTGAVRRWKRDVKLLRKVLHFFRDKERLLATAEHLDVRKRRLTLHKEELRPLKKHFPELFRDLDLEEGTFRGDIRSIHRILKVVIGEEKYLRAFLIKLEEEMPFLFEEEQ